MDAKELRKFLEESESNCIHVSSVEEWDEALDYISAETGCRVGFDRSKYRDKNFYYIYLSYDEVHCRMYRIDTSPAVEYSELVSDSSFEELPDLTMLFAPLVQR